MPSCKLKLFLLFALASGGYILGMKRSGDDYTGNLSPYWRIQVENKKPRLVRQYAAFFHQPKKLKELCADILVKSIALEVSSETLDSIEAIYFNRLPKEMIDFIKNQFVRAYAWQEGALEKTIVDQPLYEGNNNFVLSPNGMVICAISNLGFSAEIYFQYGASQFDFRTCYTLVIEHAIERVLFSDDNLQLFIGLNDNTTCVCTCKSFAYILFLKAIASSSCVDELQHLQHMLAYQSCSDADQEELNSIIYAKHCKLENTIDTEQ